MSAAQPRRSPRPAALNIARARDSSSAPTAGPAGSAPGRDRTVRLRLRGAVDRRRYDRRRRIGSAAPWRANLRSGPAHHRDADESGAAPMGIHAASRGVRRGNDCGLASRRAAQHARPSRAGRSHPQGGLLFSWIGRKAMAGQLDPAGRRCGPSNAAVHGTGDVFGASRCGQPRMETGAGLQRSGRSRRCSTPTRSSASRRSAVRRQNLLDKSAIELREDLVHLG